MFSVPVFVTYKLKPLALHNTHIALFHNLESYIDVTSKITPSKVCHDNTELVGDTLTIKHTRLFNASEMLFPANSQYREYIYYIECRCNTCRKLHLLVMLRTLVLRIKIGET